MPRYNNISDDDLDNRPLIEHQQSFLPKRMLNKINQKMREKNITMGGICFTTGVALVGIISSLPTADNAGAAATNHNPGSETPQVVGKLSLEDQAWTFTYFLCSLSVNTIVFTDYAPQALEAIPKIFKNLVKSVKEGGIAAACLYGATFSAIASFGIGEDSFVFLPYDTFIFPAVSFGLQNGVTRLASLYSISTRIRNHRNPDANRQWKLAYALKHSARDQLHYNMIRNTYAEARDHYLGETDEPTYEGLLKTFVTTFNTKHHTTPEIFHHIALWERILELQGLAFDISFAICVAAAINYTFGFKGYVGLDDILEWIGTDWLKRQSEVVQIVLGEGAGIASSAMYLRAIDYRNTLLDLYTYTRQQEKLKFAWVVTAIALSGAIHYFAAKSGQNMGQKLVDNPDGWLCLEDKVCYSNDSSFENNFSHSGSNSDTHTSNFWLDYAWKAITFIAFNFFGVFAINSKSWTELFFTRPSKTPNAKLNLETFTRKLENPVTILPMDEPTQDGIDNILTLFNDRQGEQAIHASVKNTAVATAKVVATSAKGVVATVSGTIGTLFNPQATPPVSIKMQNAVVDGDDQDLRANPSPPTSRKFSSV